MEKKIAHYPLGDVKAWSSATTHAVHQSSAALGYTYEDVFEVICDLEVVNFYKSMTSNHDHRVWQDVYHYPTETRVLYIKLQIVDRVVVIFFKEL